MMAVVNPHQKRDFKITSTTYAYLKECNSIASSERSKGKQKHNVGKKNAYDPITLKQKLFFPDEIFLLNLLVKGLTAITLSNQGLRAK